MSFRDCELKNIQTLQQIIAQPTAQLLGRWTDARGQIDPRTGLTKYGTAYQCRPGVLSLGTSTGSSPSPRALAAAEARVSPLRSSTRLGSALVALQEAVRGEIRSALAPKRQPAVVLAPSGTDGVYPALVIALSSGAPVENVIIEPKELGSGTLRAASGLHFTAGPPLTAQPRVVEAPLQGMAVSRINTTIIRSRSAGGAAREPAVIDAEVEAAVCAALAAGKRVLLHRVLHTKTGQILPSLDCAARLAARPGVDVLVDAVQGRIGTAEVQSILDSGAMLLMSGSKFYGAPPFAGLLLVPAGLADRARRIAADTIPVGLGDYMTALDVPPSWSGWREALPWMSNLGLLARWSAALAEHAAYHRIPPMHRAMICRDFHQIARDTLEQVPGLGLLASTPSDTCPPILCFSLQASTGRPLVLPELHRIHRRLNLRFGIHLGRPIAVGDHGPAVLRMALGASMAVDVAEGRSMASMLQPVVDALRVVCMTPEAA